MTQIPWLDWLLHKNWVANLFKRESIAPLLDYVLARISERQEERRKNPKSPSNANVDGPIADGDFLGYYLNAQERKDNVPLRFVSTWTFANIVLNGDVINDPYLRAETLIIYSLSEGPSRHNIGIYVL